MANKILVLEDYDDDWNLFEMATERFPTLQFTRLPDGRRGLRYLEELYKNNEELPKAVVSDCFMNPMTGPEFTKRIKKMDRFKHIPIILMPGMIDWNEADDLGDLVISYQLKPDGRDGYIKLIEKHILPLLEKANA